MTNILKADYHLERWCLKVLWSGSVSKGMYDFQESEELGIFNVDYGICINWMLASDSLLRELFIGTKKVYISKFHARKSWCHKEYVAL